MNPSKLFEKLNVRILSLVLLLSPTLNAAGGGSPMTAVPLGVYVGGGANDNVVSAPATGSSLALQQDGFVFRVHNSCYATNLRSGVNPIAPGSLIKGTFVLNFNGTDFTFWIQYLGDTTTNTGIASAGTILGITSSSSSAYSTHIRKTQAASGGVYNYCPDQTLSGSFISGSNAVKICNGPFPQSFCSDVCTKSTLTCPDATWSLSGKICSKDVVSNFAAGTFEFKNYEPPVVSAVQYGQTLQLNLDTTSLFSIGAKPTLKSATFSQVVDCSKLEAVYGSQGYSANEASYTCGTYMATTGPVSASVSGFAVSRDRTSADIYVSFPGQTAFCGSFWSPLMVFFDKNRPKFTGVSDFPLQPGVSTAWVEKDAPGYFLVYDKNDSGEIKTADQLFGNSDKDQNGFDRLAAFDLNHDKKIDVKDDIYKHLYLWQDKDADGKSTKAELTPINKKIESISLKYKSGTIMPIGKFAEERESSTIKLTKNAKERKPSSEAKIVDMWFAPNP